MKRTFTLPLPPSVNALYPGKVRRHKSDEYYAWERLADADMHKQGLRRFDHAPTQHRWRVKATCHMTSWRGDMDNTIKAAIDFIANFFRVDDRYLIELHVIRESSKTARWDVELEIEGA